MYSFSFWQKWLFSVAIIVIIFGLALAFFNQTALFDTLFNNQINPVFWSASQVNANTSAFQGWIYGVLGSTVAGWGVLIAFIAYYPFKRKEKWAWNCLAVGVGLWFVADTAISLCSRVYFNALFNTMLLVLIALPLIFTRRSFSDN